MTSNFNLDKIFGKPMSQIDSIISDMDSHVKHFEIPKKTGGTRKLIAPDETLKWIQRRLIWFIFSKYHPSDNAHGFVKYRSIVSNATPHVEPKSIGHIDVKDFFDTINENHVKNALMGNTHICKHCCNYEMCLKGECSPSIYHNKITKYKHRCEELKAMLIPDYCEKKGYTSLFKTIIKLCTYKNSAVQGFPTSPYIANMVLAGFDRKIQKIAEENNCIYTRYADDITVSSKDMDKNELRETFKNPIYRTLWAFGFAAKKEKTWWKQHGRFRVCGVIVNKKLNLNRYDIKMFRAKVHKATIKTPSKTTKKLIRSLKGWCSYLMSINETQGDKYMNKLTEFENTKWPKT